MDYFDSRYQERVTLVDNSIPTNPKDKKCEVIIDVADDGAITAMAYAPKGIVSAELVYNNTPAANPREFALLLQFPNLDKIIKGYSLAANIPIDQIKTNTENFISWFTWFISQQNVDFPFSAFTTYDTEEAALKALWSGEVFAQDPNCKNKSAEDDFLP